MTGDPGFVGASVGVIHDGKVATFNFGSSWRDANIPPTDRTLYPIASITKTFTGSLLAMAVDEGKVALDDDVRKFLHGDFPNLEFAGAPIRMRELLNHRSGLPFILPDRPELMPGYQGASIDAFAARLDAALRRYPRSQFFADLRKVTLDAIPGEKFGYSNSAAQLAGFILEDLEGASFEELVERRIARPLGMHDTSIQMSNRQRARLARGYEGAIELPPPPAALQAAGALHSSVFDLIKYLRWHMAEKDAAVALSHQPTFASGNYSAGLNWQMLNVDGVRLIWQSGNLPGYTSYMLFEPELGLGIVVLTNESGPGSTRRIEDFCNSILKALDVRAVQLPR
jgi:CubicO group peptidase (beta-lactamase class C family)